MALGVQHSLGTAAVHDLERIRDERYVACLRVGEDPDADVDLEYLERLVRDMSISVNQVVFNLENLAVRSRNTFTHPPRRDSPLFHGICGAPSASDTDVKHQEGWAMCNLGHYPFSQGIEGCYIRRHSLFVRVPGSRGSSSSPPLIPRMVSPSCTSESLPDILKWDSNGFLGDVNSDDKSLSRPFFKSSEARRWIEQQEQEAAALRTANMCPLGSFPSFLDAGKEPSSSSGGGEQGSLFGDGDLEVGAGSGAGEWDHNVLGCQDCVCHPVTMKWSYCSSSRYHCDHPHHLHLSEECCGLVDWNN